MRETATITAAHPPGIAEVTKAASTTTVLTSSSNPSSYGQEVTLTATVTSSFGGAATGTVTFYHQSTVVGTGTLSANVAKLTLHRSRYRNGTLLGDVCG